MRASAAAAAAIPAALGLLFAVAEGTWAQTGCQVAFEKWAQSSSAQVRPAPDASGRGACIATEAARQSLLDGLARTRELCGDSSDASLQPTRTLISINHSFIASLGVCRAEKADTADSWSIKTAPTPEKAPPKVAAPLPPPPPVAGGPRPSVIAPAPPKAVIVAPSVVPPKAEAGTGAPKPPCLEVAAQGDVYSLVNRRCKGHTVLAVIETRAASGETACRGYSIGVGLNLKGPSAPRVNYECVATMGGCNKDRLGDMFPECDW
jgi:hypothetical protein